MIGRFSFYRTIVSNRTASTLHSAETHRRVISACGVDNRSTSRGGGHRPPEKTMPISKLKAMPAFHTDAPPQIRHAVALFAIVWLIEVGCAVWLQRLGFDQLGEVPAEKATLMRKGIALIAVVQAFWLLLNASLIIGLCQRQKLARTLELILTIVTTLAFIVMAPPFRMTLFEVSFFANAIATVLIYSGPCSRWFQGTTS